MEGIKTDLLDMAKMKIVFDDTFSNGFNSYGTMYKDFIIQPNDGLELNISTMETPQANDVYMGIVDWYYTNEKYKELSQA